VNTKGLITTDPDIPDGPPAFKGTRLPAKTLFEYLENHRTVGELEECFPPLTRETPRVLLERLRHA
jgi:uncharacterized protein (DUF433 family)